MLYSIRALLGSGVLYWVLDASAGDRGAVDWAVIGLVVGAIVWSLFQLGRRLRAQAGAPALWQLTRALSLWAVGLLNTVLLDPAHVGGWRQWVGWAALAIACVESAALVLRESGGVAEGSAPVDASSPPPPS